MTTPHQIRIADLEIVPWDYEVLLQDPPSPELLALTKLRNDIYFWETGTPIRDVSPHTLRSFLKPNKWSDDNGYTLHFEGKLIGRAYVERPLEEEESTLAYLALELLPEFRGRGIGQQFLPVLEAEAMRSGRTTFELWSSHQNSDEERWESPAGSGSVPLDRNTRFLLKQGYALAQVERMSVFDYRESEGLLAPLREQSRTRAGQEYEYLCWNAPIPDALIMDFAEMKRQMSLDAPSGDLDVPEEVWDAERVKEHDATILDFKRVRLTGAIRHIPSGRLVAYTELENGSDTTQPSGQGDTFVLNAHRDIHSACGSKRKPCCVGENSIPSQTKSAPTMPKKTGTC